MVSIRPIAIVALAALTIALVSPAQAQTPKPTKPAPKMATKPAPKMAPQRTTTQRTTTMRSGTMAPMAGNNTATVQNNINKANKTLSDMVALLNRIDARKAGQ